jgi:hypothetical protein
MSQIQNTDRKVPGTRVPVPYLYRTDKATKDEDVNEKKEFIGYLIWIKKFSLKVSNKLDGLQC